jgi:hypothetical protein
MDAGYTEDEIMQKAGHENILELSIISNQQI